MDANEKLAAIRVEIDAVDRELTALFDRRMQLSVEVAKAKAGGGIALVNSAREQQVIDLALERSSPDNRPETEAFMRTLIELSKQRQTRFNNE